MAVVKGLNVTCVGLWWGTKALDPTSDDTTRSVVRELDVGDMILLFGRKKRKRDSMNELTIIIKLPLHQKCCIFFVLRCILF